MDLKNLDMCPAHVLRHSDVRVLGISHSFHNFLMLDRNIDQPDLCFHPYILYIFFVLYGLIIFESI